MPYDLERHREYIRITNEGKPYVELTNTELRVIRAETTSIQVVFDVEAELKSRKAIKNTFADSFSKMETRITES